MAMCFTMIPQAVMGMETQSAAGIEPQAAGMQTAPAFASADSQTAPAFASADPQTAPAFASADSQTDPAPFQSKIREINEYGNAKLDFFSDDLNNAGYDQGDILQVSFRDQKVEIPFCEVVSDVPFRKPALCKQSANDPMVIIVNGGSFAEQYGLEAGDKDIDVTLELKEKDGYLEHMEAVRVPKESLNREDYKTDEEFANFRPVNTTGMRPDLLYRTSSPIAPDFNRQTYADALLAKAGVTTMINLANTAEQAAGYEGYEETYYSKIAHKEVKMAVTYGSESFNEQLRQGLEFFTEHPGTLEHPEKYAINCTVGKDRTGFVVGVLECLTGATYNEIIDDYMATFYNFYLGMEKDPAKEKIIAEDNIVSELEYVLDVEDLKTADRPAAAEKYLLKCGMTKEQIGQLEKILCKPLSVKTKKVTVSSKTLKKKAKTIAGSKVFTVKYARGGLTFKKMKGVKGISIAKNGKVTLKKRLPKGTYKVTAKVTADSGFMGKQSKTVSLKVRVK